MKDEIKEILDWLEIENLTNILNYITNLQDRIDKAIEYINKHFHWGIGGNDNIDELLNILQGSDE